MATKAGMNGLFQSTLPVWGATYCQAGKGQQAPISIHAPRVGSDPLQQILRSSCLTFQSTLPVWGATRLVISVENVIL